MKRISKFLFIFALTLGFSPKVHAFVMGVAPQAIPVQAQGGFVGGGMAFGGYGYGYQPMPIVNRCTTCAVPLPQPVPMHGYAIGGGFAGGGYYQPRYINSGCRGCGSCGRSCGGVGVSRCSHRHRCSRSQGFRRPFSLSLSVGFSSGHGGGGFAFGLGFSSF